MGAAERLTLVALGVVLIGTPATAQPVAVLAPGYFDGGYHRPDTRFELVATLCNLGDETLYVTEVRSTCACVEPLIWPTELLPGACGAIRLGVESKDDVGLQEREVVVVTNDPVRPSHRLTLCYVVGVAARATPGSLDFGIIRPGTVLETSVEIESTLGDAGDIRRVASEIDGLTVKTDRAGITPEEPGRLTIALNAPQVLGEINATVDVATSIPGAEVVHIPVHAVVAKAVSGDVQDITMPAIPVRGTGSTSFVLQVDDGVRPVQVRARPAEFWTALTQVDEHHWRVDIAYSASDRCGPIRGIVTVQIAGNEELRFSVPVMGEVVPDARDTAPNAGATRPPAVGELGKVRVGPADSVGDRHLPAPRPQPRIFLRAAHSAGLLLVPSSLLCTFAARRENSSAEKPSSVPGMHSPHSGQRGPRVLSVRYPHRLQRPGG